MRKFLAFILAAVLMLSLVACGAAPAEPTSGSATEEKKQLPASATEAEVPAETLYKDIMKPYAEIQHGKRLVILQNTLVFSRKGIMTEDEAPVPEVVSYNGADYNAYPMAAATKFLVEELSGAVTVYSTDGASVSFEAADFEAASVLIDDFQSGNSPILLAADGTAVENFDYAAMESGEIIFSIVTEQEVNVNEYLQKFGWENTKVTSLSGSWWKNEHKEDIFKAISCGAGIMQLNPYMIKKALTMR